MLLWTTLKFVLLLVVHLRHNVRYYNFTLDFLNQNTANETRQAVQPPRSEFVVAPQSSSTTILSDISSYPMSSLYRDHLHGFGQAIRALVGTTLSAGLQGMKLREDVNAVLPVSLVGVFPKSVSLTSTNTDTVLLPAGSIVAAKAVRFTPNSAFGNELGWGQGGIAAVLLKDLKAGDQSALVREQDASDGRMTFLGNAIEVAAKSVRQIEWHNVRRGNFNCYQGIVWGCQALTQPLVLTWVANKRGTIVDDEVPFPLSSPTTSASLFASDGIRDFVDRMPKPLGHYDTICIPLSRMAQWMNAEQYAIIEGMPDTDFEAMIMHIIPDRYDYSG